MWFKEQLYKMPKTNSTSRMHPIIGKNTLFILGTLALIVISFGCKKTTSLNDPLEAGWNNQPVCEVLEENDKLRILKCTFPPGVGHERHYHNAHFGYTIGGQQV